MAINLNKGQSINLSKDTSDLSSITIGLGWKIKKKGFLKGLRGGEEFDLDAIAFMLDREDKVRNLGKQLVGSDVIFFNNLRHPTGNVIHTGDNLVGGAGVEDDEQIVVKLSGLSSDFSKILFVVSIYKGIEKKQHFGEVERAFMRAVDAKGKEIARYNLAEDPAYANMRTIVFGAVERDGNGWKFNAIGEAYPTDQFVDILRGHIQS